MTNNYNYIFKINVCETPTTEERNSQSIIQFQAGRWVQFVECFPDIKITLPLLS